MKYFAILFLVTVLSQTSFGQVKVSARLINKESKEGVAFASVRAYDSPTVGAISDGQGRFYLLFPDGIDSIRCSVSASSYFNKDITLVKSIGSQEIELEERFFELDEVVVIPEKQFEENWNPTTESLKLYGGKSDDGGFIPMMMDLESSGEYHGNAFKINKPIKLNEVSFHFFLGEGYPRELYMRIFQADDKGKLSEYQALENLTELTKETIFLDNLSDGFNLVDLSDQNILASPGYLVVAFSADLENVENRKLTIYQEKSGGKKILRYALSPGHFVIYPSFLPKYLIGFSYSELEN